MPNTLAHLGVQSLVTRAVITQADLKWIYLGCIVPDLPWIAQRAIRVLVPGLSIYDLRLYVIAQSSLLLCLLLSAALASLSRRAYQVFAILALGSAMHLVLDSLQTKWGNGVHLFAPFSWDLLNFGLFWPEEAPSVALSALGLGYYAYAWWRVPPGDFDLVLPRGRTLLVGASALVAFLLVPLALLSGPLEADNHLVRTLREVEARPGRVVTFDRADYDARAGGVLRIYTGERLAVIGPMPERSGPVSVRGRFVDRTTVLVEQVHKHWPLVRDAASYVGLSLILLFWLRAVRRGRAARLGRLADR